MSNKSSSEKEIIDIILGKLQSSKEHKKYWNISWNLGVVLSNLVEIKNPVNILEFGTSNGFSTLWIARSSNSNSKITTIDVNKERLNEAILNFKKAEVKNITCINSEILDFLENTTSNVKYDFIFLDAAHKFYEDIIKKLIKKDLLLNNAIIVADNILTHSHLSNFADKMLKKFPSEIIEIDSGFLVIEYKIT